MSVSMAAAPLRRVRVPKVGAAFLAGLIIVLVMLLAALVPQTITGVDPIAMDYDAILSPPSLAHIFGTDNLGRDVFARTVWATRIDLQIALFCTLVPIAFGTIVGSLVGFYGGIADAVLGRVVDIVITFPFLVLVIAIVAVLGPGLVNIYIAVSAVGWVFYARLVRADLLVLRRADFAAAGKVMGYSDGRIIFRHLLPNAMAPLIVYWMTDMSLCILLGSSLGYLGLGAQPPTAEWGVLVADGKNYMDTAWWISVFPGAAIVICGTGISLFGDGLAELLSVRR